MKLINYEISTFVEFLLGEELSGKETRIRARFIKVLAEKLKQVEVESKILLHEYADLDEHGELVVEVHEESGQSTYVIADIEGFQLEQEKLMMEPCIILENEENEDMMKVVRDIVFNTTRKFKNEEALAYERWCEIVESH